jgi:glycosyltransferase involved in cell wall biosynthesis
MRILLWGTYDTGKPRIRILREGLRGTPGIELQEIHASVWEGIEDKSQVKGLARRIRIMARWLLRYPELAWRLLRAPRPDVLLISYPGLVDVFVALAIARMRRIPIAWDVFLSLYDTICEDRRLVAPTSLAGKLLKATEKAAMRAADVIFMDTHAHARRIEHLFGLGDGRCGSVWVGAETEHFSPSPPMSRTDDRPLRVLFYGQFIPLHGVDTIIQAARLLRNEPIEWQVIGRGQVAPRIRAMLTEEPLPKLRWLEWVEYRQLKQFIAEADLCLGIFGTSEKAASVIPNKVFQIVAAGRPVATRDSAAIRELLPDSPPYTYLVPAGDAAALAGAVSAHLHDTSAIDGRLANLVVNFDKPAISRQFLETIRRAIPHEQ